MPDKMRESKRYNDDGANGHGYEKTSYRHIQCPCYSSTCSPTVHYTKIRSCSTQPQCKYESVRRISCEQSESKIIMCARKQRSEVWVGLIRRLE